MGVMQDSRLFEAPPVPEGAILRPLDCRGKGRHDKLGYRCANYPLEGCLGSVCKRCANKQSPKPYTETCNMCQLAEMHGSSMSKALAVLGELHPESVKSGKAGCAATIKGEKKCERCVESDCKRLGSLACQGKFWSHDRREAYCGDLCRKAAAKEKNRERQERHRVA